MSDQHHDDVTDIERRTFMKGVGATAGAAAIGLGATGTAAAHEGFHADHANFRVQEASKAWARGYRGRPDRSIGLTDTGIDARHPDVGPWNGVRAVVDRGELKLTGPALAERKRAETGRSLTFEGQAGPGTFVTGSEVVAGEFVNDGGEANDTGADVLDAELSWTPWLQDTNDLELRLDIRVEGEWEEVATAASSSNPEVMTGVQLDEGATYRFVVEQFHNAASEFEVTATFFDYTQSLETFSSSDIFDDSGQPNQLQSDPDSTAMPKVICWFNETSRYGNYERPRDPNGHGTHVSSIMGGSGRASQPVVEALITDDPRTVLTAGDFLSYDVEAAAGTGVFISAYGDGIELIIEGPDGRQLDESTVFSEDVSNFDNNIAEAPARRDGTYTAYVRPIEGELVSTARVETVRAGRLEAPADTTGNRDAAGDPTVHAGLSPDASLVGLQGLSDPTESLARFPDRFADVFNMRSVNMSWGYLGGLPFGAFGGTVGFGIVEAVKRIAEGGILTVAAAGNAATPANGNGAPAVADEAISVAATGPLDGLTSYSAGGIGAIDEDGGTYMKPDVTAPGGYDNNEVDAAKNGDPDDESLAHGDVRDYTVKAGTSMASPYTNGVAGLVAQAMEEDAPAALSLPEPAETSFEDVMRLKTVILSTASETAFTAAPYHRAHAPTYEHGGRDPYEGFGRVNPDAAVDAVARELLDGTGLSDEASTGTSVRETVGLGVPADSRAVAGYVRTRGGTLDVSVEFSHYSGGNEGMTKGDPHLDLFVYDIEPAAHGEPIVVASAAATRGSGSLSVDVPTAEAGAEPRDETHFVVAKLVNVPSVVNGYDVQAHFDLDLEFTAGVIPPVTTEFTASGRRSDDSDVFTGGQTDRVEVTIEAFQNADEVAVRDQLPDGWTVDERFGDVESFDPETGVVSFEGTVTASDVAEDREVTFTYFAEAPSGADSTGGYEFGPAEAEVVVADVPSADSDGELDGNGIDSFGGTDTNAVVAASTEV